MSESKATGQSNLSQRALHFLKLLVERYIQDGHPIGSRTLAKDAGLELSSATIRNVLADLEDLGLVTSPHTSAGRIPTISGYRLFLDCLITLKPLDTGEVASIREQLGVSEDSSDILCNSSRLLSVVTHMAGVVRLPKRELVTYRQIEFLRLEKNKILTILVTQDDEVHNRVIYTSEKYTPAELEQAANYLNVKFFGRTLATVRAELLTELHKTKHAMNQVMANALELANQVMQVSNEDAGFSISGETNLMDFDELANMERLKQLFQIFTEKHKILQLLDQCMAAESTHIFIGGESDNSILDGLSLVTAPYTINNRVVGVLGVIGPTRMAYNRVIPIVDATARLLGTALEQR
ncbi:HrcA family transcriptional regulator [Achromatium sp. WMS2]|nr:HrcA family transcriptional regulator [Achromatium sp. WMS2]